MYLSTVHVAARLTAAISDHIAHVPECFATIDLTEITVRRSVLGILIAVVQDARGYRACVTLGTAATIELCRFDVLSAKAHDLLTALVNASQ